MTTIKIRFVEKIYKDSSKHYYIQCKRWYGWHNIFEYDKSSQNLLDTVLEKYFKTCKQCVKIIEYPSLKIY
jgi:hypothetical protein